MADYSKIVNFAAKDALISGNPNKAVQGTELNTEFDNIATASNTKADKASPTFTGTVNTAATISTVDDAVNSATTSPQQLIHTTSGTPANGIGVSTDYVVETTAGNNETGMVLGTVVTDVTSTSEDFDFVVDLMAAGAPAAEKFRVSSAGVVTAQTFNGNLIGSVIGNVLGDLEGFVNTPTQTAITSLGTLTSLTVDNVTVNGAAITSDTGAISFGNENLNTTGTVTATTYTGALASTVTATTQAASDNSTKVATTAYVDTSSAAHDSLPEVLVVGNTTGGTDLAVSAGDDITFTDTSKAIFGAGSDLQIFHDGINSYIKDAAGTGNLYIDSNQLIINNSPSNENMARFAEDGAVTLYNNGSAKLATTATGIDVTGKVTATNILEASDGTNGEMQFGLGTALTTGAGTYDSSVRWNGSSGNLLFSQGAVEKMRITNTGIDVTGTATMDGLTVEDTNPTLLFKTTGGGVTDEAYLQKFGDDFYIYNKEATGKLFLGTNNGTDLTIDSSGNIGIGTSAPSEALHLSSGGLLIDSNIPNAPASGTSGLIADYFTHTARFWSRGDATTRGSFEFKILENDGGSQIDAMVIDSIGNFLVGKTAASSSTAGGQFNADGFMSATRDGSTVAHFNRLTDDGTIIELRKDSVAVGSIGTTSGTFWIGSGDTGLVFDNSTVNSEQIRPYHTGTGTRDAAIDLGSAGGRFKDLYLSGGVYLGGTVAANLLDDYEEGTWTPTLHDATTAGNAASLTGDGAYTKVGNLVTVTAQLLNIDTTGMTGGNAFYVGGLPFTAEVGPTSKGLVQFESVAYQAGTYCNASTISGSSRVAFIENVTGAATGQPIVSDITSTTGDIWFTLAYYV